jgi:hypothetical protein
MEQALKITIKNFLNPLWLTWSPMSVPLKVPKCEIFDRSDINDFYTIKSLCEGDFGVKKNYKNIYGFT